MRSSTEYSFPTDDLWEVILLESKILRIQHEVPSTGEGHRIQTFADRNDK